MTPQAYYRSQSTFSNPGPFAYLYDDLPDDLDSLCRAIRGIYVHYLSGRFSQARKQEIDLRYISAILKQVLTHDNRPLSQKRPKSKRVVGCCRDAALLLCSMLRHKGTPARIRVGFATYIRAVGENFNVDHVVTEYWDESAHVWKLVDPEQGEALIKTNRIDFDVHNIPRDRFLVAGKAWQMCRRGEAKADIFGAAPGSFFSGLWAIRNRLILDLAALNKMEVLLWDGWEWTEQHFIPSEADLQLLDHMAFLTQGGDADFPSVLAMYADPRFQVPATVMCYSPAAAWQRVNLETA
jgi:hypothetical protein